MRVQFQHSLKTAIALAGIATIGLALSAPAALADLPDFDYSLTGEEFDPLTSENQFYSLEAWDLVRRGFICVNNPNEDCTGEVLNEDFDPDAHRVPVPRYEVTEATRMGFVCVNNVNPACEEPVHYGVIYGDPEPEIPLNARIAALWAELDSLANRPTTLPALAPAPEPPILAPVPGLW